MKLNAGGAHRNAAFDAFICVNARRLEMAHSGYVSAGPGSVLERKAVRQFDRKQYYLTIRNVDR